MKSDYNETSEDYRPVTEKEFLDTWNDHKERQEQRRARRQPIVIIGKLVKNERGEK